MSPSWLRDTRWRTREEAVAATAGPKRREPMEPEARQSRKAEAIKASASFIFHDCEANKVKNR
jgi:hypothetical protein